MKVSHATGGIEHMKVSTGGIEHMKVSTGGIEHMKVSHATGGIEGAHEGITRYWGH